MSNNLICLGKQNNMYLYINSTTLELSQMPNLVDSMFNEKKYIGLKRKFKIIYSVVGEICYSKAFKSLEGYIIADDKGNIDILTPDQLLKKVQKSQFLNYSVAYKDNSPYFRRNPGVCLNSFENSEIKKIIGYDLNSFNLDDKNITPLELEMCMKRNGFKLGYSKKFKATTYGDELYPAYHNIYFNKEGTQIVLNMVEDKAGVLKLNWFGSEIMLMRHVNSKKYLNYIKNNAYDMGSTSPIDGVNTDITIFTNSYIHKFMRIARNGNTYSTGCIPYYMSKQLDGWLSLTHLTPIQHKWVEKTANELENSLKIKNIEISIILDYLIGYYNVLKYSPELQRFYKYYLQKENGFFEVLKLKMNRYTLTDKDIEKLKNIVLNAYRKEEI